MAAAFATALALGSVFLSEAKLRTSCHVPGTCPADRGLPSPAGFTNTTGWAPDGASCCDICAARGTNTVNCFDPATCGQKTGDNDWDFLVFDQMWLPQFCTALAEGHDPTLTHPPGSTCRSDARRSTGLSIHGLWPNYINGYPQCCKHVVLDNQKLPGSIQRRAMDEWVDPTTASNSSCAFCSMWAHEMMKHGTCFATDMVGYFNTSLGILDNIGTVTRRANTLLGQATQSKVRTAELHALYSPFVVQILCDGDDVRSSDSIGMFLELRTCWNRTEAFSASQPRVDDLFQIDCPGKPVGTPCPDYFRAAGSQEDDGDL